MIEFVNIRTNEKRKLTRPHQIGAWLNSSDLSPNSSKGQDFGWRLAPEVVVKIDEMAEDPSLLADIAKRVGVEVDELTTIHLVQHISYLDDLKQRTEERKHDRTPEFKDDYEASIKAIKEKQSAKKSAEKKPAGTSAEKK